MQRIIKQALIGSVIVCACFITAAAAQTEKQNLGVVIIAHGAPMPMWNQKVVDLAAQVKCPYPVEPAFLDFAQDKTLENAVRKLEAKGANAILVVHLSPSSYSNHHDELFYLVGQRKDLGVFTATAPPPIKSSARFAVSPAMDEHPLIVQILTEHAREISQDPSRESLILLGHGPVEELENIMWVRQLKHIGNTLTRILPFKEVACMTLRSDAPDLVRDDAHENLRETAMRMSKQGRVLVVVYALGSHMNQEISRILAKVPSVVISQQSIISSPKTVHWVEATIRNGMNQPAAPPVYKTWSQMEMQSSMMGRPR